MWSTDPRTDHGEQMGRQALPWLNLLYLRRSWLPLLCTLWTLASPSLNKMEVQNAAQAGAQYAIGQVSYDSSKISSAVTNATKFTAVTPTSSEFCGCPTATGVKFCAASCNTCNTGTCSLTTQGHYVTVNCDTANRVYTVGVVTEL